jgi:hypothetical protein
MNFQPYRLQALVFATLLAGCGGSAVGPEQDGGLPDGTADDVRGTDDDAHADAPAEAMATHADGGGYCCTPSATPACCMHFGGWTDDPAGCGETCDGFALPTHLSKDAHGCDVWTGGTGPKCGQATFDAGPDADTNPPGCPATYGTDGGACPISGSCRYPQGFCDCESSHCGGAAPPPDASFASVWTCLAMDPSCPVTVPDAGGACQAGVSCSYGSCCKPKVACSDAGTWQHEAMFCPP